MIFLHWGGGRRLRQLVSARAWGYFTNPHTRRSQTRSHNISPELLRKWVERRKIELNVSALGQVTYPLRNVIRILEIGHGIH